MSNAGVRLGGRQQRLEEDHDQQVVGGVRAGRQLHPAQAQRHVGEPKPITARVRKPWR